jgi:hypothetical protein
MERDAQPLFGRGQGGNGRNVWQQSAYQPQSHTSKLAKRYKARRRINRHITVPSTNET